MPKLMLIDANNLLYKAAYSTRSAILTTYLTEEGEINTGAVYQFTITVTSLFAQHKAVPVLCWDPNWKLSEPLKGGEWLERTKIFPGYKAARGPKNEVDLDFHRDLEQQRNIIKKLFSFFGCLQATSPGWEADDIIATLAKKYSGKGVLIVTSDRDLFPLLEFDGVDILNAGLGYQLRDREWFEETYPGIHPGLWVQYRALTGDPSDGIPGVKGIGDKFALELIKAFGSARNAVRAAERWKAGDEWPTKRPKQVCSALSGSGGDVVTYLQVLKLNYNAELIWIKRRHGKKKAFDFLRELKFKSFWHGSAHVNTMALIDACK